MNASGSHSPSRGREALAAGLFYLAVLGIAFVPQWLSGSFFFTEVIWDPTPLYLQYPGDRAAIQAFSAGQIGGLWDHSRGLGTQLFVPTYLSYCNFLKLPAYIFNAPWAWEAYLFVRLLLAGFFTFWLARFLPLPFLPALFAGTAYMLCGYFRIFLTFQHLNLEVFFPALLFSQMLFFRRPSLGRCFIILFFLFQMWTGGNPTVFVYAFLLSGGFHLFLAGLSASHSPRPWRVLGLALSLFILLWAISFLWFAYGLTAVEFSGQVWKLRLPDIGRLRIPLHNLVALLTPLFDYWLSPLPSTREAELALLNFVPGYLGITVSALALFALFHLPRVPRAGLFFVILLSFGLGFVFGIPPFNLLEYLPVLNDSQNFRYAQSLVALPAAMLAGMGLHLFLSPPHPRLRRRAMLFLSLVLLAYLTWHFNGYRRFILTSSAAQSLLLRTGLLVILIGLGLAAVRFGLRRTSLQSLWGPAVLGLGAGELICYFYFITPLYGPQAYSIHPPPAVAWLKSRPGKFRIFGAQAELIHPNLAGVWGLEDIRESTPVYLRRYLQLISRLNGLESEPEILSHYFEHGRFYFDLDLQKLRPRLLDLLNVRYLLSLPARDRLPLDPTHPAGHGIVPLGETTYLLCLDALLNGVHRPALLTHAPSRALLPLPSSPSRNLVWEIGLLPQAASNPKADGAWLMLLCPGPGTSRLVCGRFLHPHPGPPAQGWIPMRAVLPPESRQIIFASLPGPGDNRESDLAVWGEPGFEQTDPWPNLKPVYDQEIRIYENTTVLPRAFWVKRAEWISSEAEVLARLQNEEVEPGKLALIHARPPYSELSGEPGPAEVELREHEFGRARVKVRAGGAGWLVLSDLYYPGWEARVDGKPVRIFPVDVAFRGVPLPAGEHEILFRYHSPVVRLSLWMMFTSWSQAILILVGRKIFSPGKSRRD